jgi:hypothetical protein
MQDVPSAPACAVNGSLEPGGPSGAAHPGPRYAPVETGAGVAALRVQPPLPCET